MDKSPSRNTALVWGVLAIGLAILSVTGCSSIEALSGPTATPTATLVPTFTPLPTATATPSITATPTATATPTVTPTPALPPLAAAVVLEPAQVAQGSTGIVRVTSQVPARATGTVQERPLRFFTDDGLRHTALVGIDAMAALEAQPVRIIVETDDGQTVSLEATIEVIAGGFETEHLVFEPATDALLDPDVSRPEYLLVSEIYAGYSPDARWRGAFAWPVAEPPYVTSAFGTRRQYGERFASYHAGTDLRSAVGAPVTAAAEGIVVLAEELMVRGRAVILDHGCGVLSGYFHLDSIGIMVGQRVALGEQIGTSGATGLVTGSHLHWEVRVSGVAVDAVEWTTREYR